jgi:hypothetical protein
MDADVKTSGAARVDVRLRHTVKSFTNGCVTSTHHNIYFLQCWIADVEFLIRRVLQSSIAGPQRCKSLEVIEVGQDRYSVFKPIQQSK